MENCNSNGYNKDFFAGKTDIFLTRFSNIGDLQWSTYFGGDGREDGPSMAIDSSNNLFITGSAGLISNISSYDFVNPGNRAYFQNSNNGGADLLVAKFTPDKIELTPTQINPSICKCDASVKVTINCTLPPYTYTWSNGIIQKDTKSVSSTITNLCLGNYWVEVKNPCSGKDTLRFTIVNPAGILTIKDNVMNSSCEKDNGSIQLSVSGGTKPYKFSWSPLVSTDSTANNLNAGIYITTITDSSCTPITLQKEITISTTTQPKADFSFTTGISCEGITYSFANDSKSANSYEWLFGDNSWSTETAPSHIFAKSGLYKTILIAKNNLCSDSTTKSIALNNDGDLVLYSANLFTPNNDGWNDCFYPSLNNINSEELKQCIQFTVYNRWGIKVFESSASKTCWDGISTEGNFCAEGTYFYIAKLKNSAISGYVTLMK